MRKVKIDEIVSEWAKEGVHIPKELIEYLIWYCNRKMDVSGIENREEYLLLLFRDELKNHLFREYVNGTMLMKMLEGYV